MLGFLLTFGDAYDVNVSPDKRTILLHDQGALLESLKACFTLGCEKPTDFRRLR